MAEFYTFGTKYPEGVTPSNPLEKVPQGMIQPLMADRMTESLNKSYEEGSTRLRVGDCCVDNPPCKTWVSYRPRYSGCGNMSVRWDQLKSRDPSAPCNAFSQGSNFEVGAKAPGIWVADLNPIHLQHAMQHGAEWWGESAAHPRARQLFTQFLVSTLPPQSDPNTKRIDNYQDTLAYTSCKYGKPQFVSF